MKKRIQQNEPDTSIALVYKKLASDQVLDYDSIDHPNPKQKYIYEKEYLLSSAGISACKTSSIIIGSLQYVLLSLNFVNHHRRIEIK